MGRQMVLISFKKLCLACLEPLKAYAKIVFPFFKKLVFLECLSRIAKAYGKTNGSYLFQKAMFRMFGAFKAYAKIILTFFKSLGIECFFPLSKPINQSFDFLSSSLERVLHITKAY
jgi:hypothetical protein